MSNRRIGVGIIGVGLVAQGRHIPNIEKLVDLFKLEAVCDLNEELGKKVAEAKQAKYYKDITEMGKDPNVDLIVVAVPGVFHKECGLQALAMGKDVIMEKPIAINLAETDALIACAKQNHRHLFVHHNRRWDADFLTVQRVLAEKHLGEVFLIESKVGKFSRVRGCTVGPNIDWRLTKKFGGGRLNEWGTHLIDQLLLLADSEPVSVYADLKNKCWFEDAEDHVNILIKFKNGLLGKIEISQSARILLLPRWFLCGTQGTLMGIFGIAGETQFSQEGFTLKVGGEAEIKEIAVTLAESSGLQFYQNVYDVMRKQAEPVVTLEQVRKTMAVVDAARQSNESGNVVFL